jgi:hypothetical protein
MLATGVDAANDVQEEMNLQYADDILSLGPLALQRDLGAFVYLDATSSVAQDQRGSQPAQGTSYHRDA